MMPPNAAQDVQARLLAIEQARRTVMADGGNTLASHWQGRHYIEESWRRCMAVGYAPTQAVEFDVVSHYTASRAIEANRSLLTAGRPVMHNLGRAIAGTHYFAILTNADGVVVDTNGPIDRHDRRAELITRIGVDLSEHGIGTSAIGTALHQLHPVWLHRGEHFFTGLQHYSCAGAPVFNPDGQCAGMLDLTGIDQPERPELIHLAAQAARGIENAMVLNCTHVLLLRLNWPGRVLGDETDGLVAFDGDGWVVGANSMARQMVQPLGHTGTRLHCRDLLAMPHETLFNAAMHNGCAMEVPLWSGLRLNAQALPQGQISALVPTEKAMPGGDTLPLRNVEIALIQKAVQEARGNVVVAARALGISRATIYRKLGMAKGR